MNNSSKHPFLLDVRKSFNNLMGIKAGIRKINMVQQGWVNNKNKRIFYIGYIQNHKAKEINIPPILCISGFREPICDIDYYMGKLSRFLYDKGCTVYQVDLYAHGESSGEIRNITIEKIIASFHAMCQKVFNDIGKYPIVIARGVIGSLLAQFSNVKTMICINPFFPDINLSNDSICEILKLIKEKSNTKNKIQFYNNPAMDNILPILQENQLIDDEVPLEFILNILNTSYNRLSEFICLRTSNDRKGLEHWNVCDGFRMSTVLADISIHEDARWQINSHNTIFDIVKNM